MKKLQLIIFAFLIIGCSTQQFVESTSSAALVSEPGKCYFSINTSVENNTGKALKKPYLLEISPTEYKKVEVKYSDEELKKYEDEDDRYFITTTKAHTTFLLKKTGLNHYTNIPEPEGYMICLVPIPPYTTMYTKEELLSSGNLIVERQIVTPSKILRKHVKKQPKKILKNQYYVKSDYWTDLKVANRESSCGRKFGEIEKKLVELGYDLEINNILEEKDREALLDFQKKNGLKQGQLDFHTLRKLGFNI